MVLSITNAALDAARFVSLVIELHFLYNALNQTFRIRGIINGKVRRKANGLSLTTKNA